MSAAVPPPLSDELRVGRGEVHVLVAAAPQHPQALGSALDSLVDEERSRIASFRDPGDGASFAAGRALVRLALARLLESSPRELVFDTWCTRCRSPRGKPRVVDPSAAIEFSLSRGGRWLALALALTPVGVDLEWRDRLVDGAVADTAFAENERTELEAVDAQRLPAALLDCWTRKEAILKALGHGLAVDPASVSVTFLEGVAPAIRNLPAEFGPASAWSLLPFDGQDWVGAAAVKGSSTLRVWDAQHVLDGRTRRSCADAGSTAAPACPRAHQPTSSTQSTSAASEKEWAAALAAPARSELSNGGDAMGFILPMRTRRATDARG